MRVFITVMVALILLVLVVEVATADNKHHSTTNVYTDSKGIASAISAAQCHFDNASKSLQVCGAVGFADGNQAQTAGIAKKYNGMLINGTVSTEDGITRFGAGITIKIK